MNQSESMRVAGLNKFVIINHELQLQLVGLINHRWGTTWLANLQPGYLQLCNLWRQELQVASAQLEICEKDDIYGNFDSGDINNNGE